MGLWYIWNNHNIIPRYHNPIHNPIIIPPFHGNIIPCPKSGVEEGPESRVRFRAQPLWAVGVQAPAFWAFWIIPLWPWHGKKKWVSTCLNPPKKYGKMGCVFFWTRYFVIFAKDGNPNLDGLLEYLELGYQMWPTPSCLECNEYTKSENRAQGFHMLKV